MFITCPKCEEEIDVIITSFGSQGSYFEPPEGGEYDFDKEHPCQATWTDAEQDEFDNLVWSLAEESRNEPDWF